MKNNIPYSIFKQHQYSKLVNLTCNTHQNKQDILSLVDTSAVWGYQRLTLLFNRFIYVFRKHIITISKRNCSLSPFGINSIGKFTATSLVACSAVLFNTRADAAEVQKIDFTFVKPDRPFWGITINTRSVPTFADIDGDGDVDAFIGNSEGTIIYFKNTGSQTFPHFVVQQAEQNPFINVDVGINSTPALVDIDNDGDFDVFIGKWDGTVEYYKNTGSKTDPVFIAQAPDANPFNTIDVGNNSAPAFADIDGDGRIDAFIGESSGNINYYKNTGSMNAPVFVVQNAENNPLSGVTVNTDSTLAFADIDQDGDLDAFIGESSGKIHSYTNNGSKTSPFFVAHPADTDIFKETKAGSFSSPALIDIDGDGDFDAIIGDYTGTIFVKRNIGSPTAPSLTDWENHQVPLSDQLKDKNLHPAFADINGDGNFDAAVGGEMGSIKFYKNGILQTIENNPFGDINVSYNSAPAFVDIDGDGDFDLFIGDYGGSITYYKNTGSRHEPVFVAQASENNPLNDVNVEEYSVPAFVDIDGDGDFDAFIGENEGTLIYYKNTGTVTDPIFAEQTNATNPFNGVDVGSMSTPAFVDIDGDGDFDAFIGEYDGTIRYYKNTGSKIIPFFVAQIPADNPFNGVDVGYNSSPAFVDTDHDRDFDLFIGNYSNFLYYFRNGKNKFQWNLFLPTIILNSDKRRTP